MSALLNNLSTVNRSGLARSCCCVVVSHLLLCGQSVAQEQTEIDGAATISEFLERSWSEKDLTPAASCSDQTFVRRVTLDLAGRIPTPQEVDTFLADGRADRRRHLVDLLIRSEDHVQHFADTFDTLLMGRGSSRDYGERSKHQWRAYLEGVFRENRPWNEVVAEILRARPQSDEERGAVWFLYERKDNHQAIAEAVAPAFFGIRIECAQCHDHMIAHEIEQRHYWGLVAFFNRGKNVNTKNGPRVSESAVGGFSDFANLEGDSSPNRLTFFQAPTIDETRPGKDDKQDDAAELYEESSVDGDPRVPRFSRREELVREVAADHPLVARALVNRVWAMLMGRGIVHPFDEMDSVHEPSHPELLDWLAEDFRKSGYDIRRLVRTIVLNRGYQLDSRRPEGIEDPATFAWSLERPLTAEQLARSIQLAVRGAFQNDDALVDQLRQRLKEVLAGENITTVQDALFLTNNRALNEYIQHSKQPTHLIPRLKELGSPDERVTVMFKTIFGRSPSMEERQAVLNFVTRTEGDDEAIEHIVWALLTSAEFRLNH